MIEWLKSLFTTRRAVLDLTDQLILLRSVCTSLEGRMMEMQAAHSRLVERVDKLEEIDKLNARVSTAKRETARNWSAFRQMAEQAEGVEPDAR